MLAVLVGQAQYLKTLKVRVPDTFESANTLGIMLQQNQSLTHFWCDLKDDPNYSLLSHAVKAKNLNRLDLPFTIIPSYPLFIISLSSIPNTNLNITFAAKKSLNTSSLVRSYPGSILGKRGLSEDTSYNDDPRSAAWQDYLSRRI